MQVIHNRAQEHQTQLLIIIMEICTAPTLWLKAVNKHTHITYIEMENVIQKNMYIYIDKCSSIIMQKMHTHTHTVQTDRSEGQCGLTEIFWEEKCLELAFEGRESSRVPDVLGEIVPDVEAKV